MSRADRRRLLFVVAAAGALFIGYRLFPSADSRIRDRILGVARALSTGQAGPALRLELERSLEPGARIRVADLADELSGAAGAARFWQSMLASLGPVALHCEQLEIARSAGHARAEFELTASYGSGMRWRQLRHVTLHLSRDTDAWRIARVEIGDSVHDQPEARP